MSFAKKPAPAPRRLVFRAARVPTATFVRTAVFGLVAIAGAAGALVRHYTHELPPLRVPVTPRTAPTYDADAGEMPVPDLVDADGG